MDRPGRISAASLSVLAVGPARLLAPPAGMPEIQAAVWAATVASKPADWFGPDSIPILTAYVKAVDTHRIVCAEMDEFDPEWLKTDDGLRRYDKLTQIQDRAAKQLTTLATKMRLTQQSRYVPHAAARADARVSAARPWSRVMDNETSTGSSPIAESRKVGT